MTYETVAVLSQAASLVLFMSLFAVVLVWVLRPKMKERLERAQREALDLELKNTSTGGRS
jgi:cbb3-type cytochrome oxidase subunit 3